MIAGRVADVTPEGFPPIGLAFVLFFVGFVLAVGTYGYWRNGDPHIAGIWRGRSTAMIPLAVGAVLMGLGVLFGNLVKEEHVVTVLLMSCGGLGVLLMFLAMIWMPSAMRPGAGGRRY